MAETRKALGKAPATHPLADEDGDSASQPASQQASKRPTKKASTKKASKATTRTEPAPPADPPEVPEPPATEVTISFRGPAALRKRMRLASIETGAEMQAMCVAALEAWLEDRGL